MSYFCGAATSRGPEIPVLIKSRVFHYAAQLVRADYCSFTSPGLSPLSKNMSCVSQTEPMGATALTSQNLAKAEKSLGNKWKRTE